MADKQRPSRRKQPKDTKSITYPSGFLQWRKREEAERVAKRAKVAKWNKENPDDLDFVSPPPNAIHVMITRKVEWYPEVCGWCLQTKEEGCTPECYRNYWKTKKKGNDLRLDDPEATTTATNASPKPHHHKEG